MTGNAEFSDYVAARRRVLLASTLATAAIGVTVGGASMLPLPGHNPGDSTASATSTSPSPTPTTTDAATLALPCPPSEQERSDLVVDGPAAAVVHVLDSDGSVARTYQLTKREDGWWPDDYAECLD